VSGKLPFAIREAIVSVCGKAFWFKDPLKSFLASCGVSAELFDRFYEESKFKIARHILSELDALGDDGYLIQRKIVTELCKLRNVPDDNVTDKDEALQALRSLKELAIDQKLAVEEQQTKSDAKLQEARRKQADLAARSKKMEELRTTFATMVIARDDPQARGYSLEDLLAELFEAHELQYRRPYKTQTEQIDGHFKFRGFDYLVEARWRRDPPNLQDLGGFKTKVDKMITSTRGLFLSIVGFRPEVVNDIVKGVTSNIILVDGQDLSIVLEGHVSLEDALELKVRKAAQEGIIYFPLSQRFTSN
jgi:hypothetical protein